MPIVALVVREIKNAFYYDARRAIFLFGAAAAYLILFSILYFPGVVKEIPTVICNEENTAYSRNLIQLVDDDERLNVIGVVNNIDEARQMLHEKKAYVAVVISADFSRKILNGGNENVLFIFNGANIITTNIASAAGNDIINTFNQKFAARQAALRTGGDENVLGQLISPVTTTIRMLNNPVQSYMLFFMLGLAMAAMQQGIFLAIGAAVQGDISTTAQLTGISKTMLLAVKVSVYWVLAMLSFGLICTITALVGIPNKAPWEMLFCLAGAFSLAAIALGVLVASLCTNELQYVRASIMYTVPAFIFGGYTWPIESMGPYMQMAAELFPMTWMANAIRELFLAGNLAMFSQNILALMSIGGICLLFGSWLFQRRFT